MKKPLLFIFLLSVFAVFTNAQTVTTSSPATTDDVSNNTVINRCGSYDALQLNMLNDSIFRQQREVFETYVENWIKDHPDYDSKTTVYIPVVVHILWKTSAQNIPDSRVTAQIAATNADFAGTNTHSMEAFSTSLKANTNIQFCLAHKDPYGHYTTGITRTQTTVSTFNTDGYPQNCSGYPERCFSSGGHDAWDVKKYLNIWVCNLGNSLCGISEFPTNPLNNYYGSTINYIYFGTTGSTPPYNLGGTLTHELGHCFNLYHIWGDDGGSCTGTDYNNDTPNQASENMNTSNWSGVHTDACATSSPGMMYMNFMDYSDDIDYANFTPNQVSRMAAVIGTSGPGHLLTTSDGCSNGVGIDEFENVSNINIFPNPTKDIFNVTFDVENSDNVVITINNIVGDVVAKIEKQNVTSVNVPIDLSEQSAGIYYVHIQSSKQSITNKISLIK
jgi:hypothetical protein